MRRRRPARAALVTNEPSSQPLSAQARPSTGRKIYRVWSRDTRELAPTTGAGGGEATAAPVGWQSVVTMPRMWLAAGLGVSALFGGGVALFSGDPLHRLWGTSAGIAYALAAVTVLAFRRRRDTAGIDIALAIVTAG